MLALDGELVARGKGGDRTIAARDFFTGVFQTALAPDEMLVEVRVPKTGLSGWSYVKMHRRAQDWATVAVAAITERSNGSIGKAPRRPDEYGGHGPPSLGGGGRDRRRSVDR